LISTAALISSLSDLLIFTHQIGDQVVSVYGPQMQKKTSALDSQKILLGFILE